VLDKERRPVPLGVTVELCIAGDSVGIGYVNDNQMTKMKFVPFAPGEDEPEITIYRTGDLVKMQPDGNIVFIERIDHQVKIRGFRIEVGEIEARLLNHEQVKEAVVIVKETTDGDKYLCAYLVPAAGTGTVPPLKEYLAQTLPEYMIPPYYMFIDEMPLTPNGKIDKKALPEPDTTTSKKCTPPENEIQQKLVAIWSGILKIKKEKISIDDNFFQLGGHSLKATRLVSKIHKELDVNLPLSQLFKKSTVRAIDAYIENAVKAKFISIEPAEKKDRYLLSSTQKRMYILQQKDTKSTAYNIFTAALLQGSVEPRRLEKVFRALVKRHESLRTTFEIAEGEPVQRIHDHAEFVIHNSENKENTGIESKQLKQYIRPFELGKAPLLRVALIKQNHDTMTTVSTYRMIIDMHHIISDGTSVGVLVAEFMKLYEGKTLQPLRIQYKDYSRWQDNQRQGEALKRQEAYWQEQFQGEISVAELPYDQPRPVYPAYAGKQVRFDMGIDTTMGLKKIVLEEEITLYMLLLTLFNILLRKLTGVEDIVTGTPVVGRRHEDLSGIIGMFVNTLALRNYPEGEKTLGQFIDEVRQRTLKAFENQEYQFEDLVANLSLSSETGRNPLFDVMFTMQNMEIPSLVIPGLKMQPFEMEVSVSKFDITFIAEENEDNLNIDLEYSSELFKEETVLRFISYFKQLTASVLEEREQRISQIEVIPASEKQQLLINFNNTATEYPKEKTIYRIFEEQVEKTPDNTAIISEEKTVGSRQYALGKEKTKDNKTIKNKKETIQAKESAIRENASSIQSTPSTMSTMSTPSTHLTYRQLNQKADKIAARLIQEGTQTGDIVAIMV
ncbi:MAG: AMP-binding protein, partial [bacterium]|nr:AMP-binding protein [bacterium]